MVIFTTKKCQRPMVAFMAGYRFIDHPAVDSSSRRPCRDRVADTSGHIDRVASRAERVDKTLLETTKVRHGNLGIPVVQALEDKHRIPDEAVAADVLAKPPTKAPC